MKAIERIAIVICVAVTLRQLSFYFSGYILDMINARGQPPLASSASGARSAPSGPIL